MCPSTIQCSLPVFGFECFKEAISQQESEEENGCGLIVFGVTFLCLCHFPLQEFVGLGLL